MDTKENVLELSKFDIYIAEIDDRESGLKKEVIRSNLCTTLLRLFPELTPEERNVFRQGIRSMYNKDFLLNYLQKDDDTVVFEECLPEESHLEKYFKNDAPRRGPADTDVYYANLEKLWYIHVRPGTVVRTNNVRDFLFNMMYNLRLIRVIADDKKISQVARHLTRYINKATESTIELPPFEKEE